MALRRLSFHIPVLWLKTGRSSHREPRSCRQLCRCSQERGSPGPTSGGSFPSHRKMCERSSKNCLIASEPVCPGKKRKRRQSCAFSSFPAKACPAGAQKPPERQKGKASQKQNISEMSAMLSANERRRALNRERRYERYEAVKALRAQGSSHYAIADTLGLSRPTVRYFLNAEYFPERRDQPKERHKGVVAPYLPFYVSDTAGRRSDGRDCSARPKIRVHWFTSAVGGVTTQWRKHLTAPPLLSTEGPAFLHSKMRGFPRNKPLCSTLSRARNNFIPEQYRHLEELCQASPDLARATNSARTSCTSSPNTKLTN